MVAGGRDAHFHADAEDRAALAVPAADIQGFHLGGVIAEFSPSSRTLVHRDAGGRDQFRADMGQLHTETTLRPMIIGSTLLALGVETVLMSFVLSMMGIERKR